MPCRRYAITALMSLFTVGTPCFCCVPRAIGLARLPLKIVATPSGSAPASGKLEISVPAGSKKPHVSENRFAGIALSPADVAQVLQTTVLPLSSAYLHRLTRAALPARSQFVYLAPSAPVAELTSPPVASCES